MNTSVIAVAHRVNAGLQDTLNLLGSLLMTKLMGVAFSPHPNLVSYDDEEGGKTSILTGHQSPWRR